MARAADSSGQELPGPRAVAVDTRFELARLRAGFETRIFSDTERWAAPRPPPELFELVHYAAPLGANAAYVTPPVEGTHRPALIWIAGGFDWNIGSWTPGPRENDQSAMTFHHPDLVLMKPSLRGSNENPGRNECFLGEVDDVLSALAYLKSRADVDPDRIYLGGHSTGATMALLVAASSADFRAVFAFGPVSDPRNYGDISCLPPSTEGLEARLRSPIEFVHEIRTPTFLIEGATAGNAVSCQQLMNRRGSAPLQFLKVAGGDHFNVIAPGSEVVLQAILRDVGPEPKLDITVAAIAERFAGQ